MSDRRGFALLATLWFIVMLTAAAALGAETAWAHRRSAINRLDAALTESAARGGLAHAEAVLNQMASRTGDGDRFLYPGGDAWRRMAMALSDTVKLDAVSYQVELRDPGAYLSLNLASEEELRRLLVALRIDAGRADRVAQAIADWRDGDEFRRGRGAERNEYRASGSRLLPRNAPFSSVAELRDVLGVDLELYPRVEPFLTVRGSGAVNLNAAPAEVLLCLPGMNEEIVNVVVRARERGRPLRNFNELLDALSPSARTRVTESLPQLLPRVSFVTREVLASASAFLPSSPVGTVADGLFVVEGRHVFRTAEWIR